MTFQTEYEFELPRGFVDDEGNVHKRGVMRLATAADEILLLKDPRVQRNPNYLQIILLSRVVVNLEGLTSVNTHVIERLFSADLAYLQDFYQRINDSDTPAYKVKCPHCHGVFDLPVDFFSKVY